jgi:hypothetical protein
MVPASNGLGLLKAVVAFLRQAFFCPGLCLALGGLLGFVLMVPAVTLEDLRKDGKITPRRFAGHFSEFTYEYHEEVQPPSHFLGRQAGDCDDYATLADLVLKEKGFNTRLISVRMPGLLTHVVCYVIEDKIYLDYNNRSYLIKTEKSSPTLRQIADKVSRSFSANWNSASEFRFQNGLKYHVSTLAKTDPEDRPLELKQAEMPTNSVSVTSSQPKLNRPNTNRVMVIDF